jgi:hypothetical protein
VLQTRYTSPTADAGNLAAQAVPSQSLGGFAATTEWRGGSLGDLFNLAAEADVRDARPDYRCVYLLNAGSATLTGVKAYLTPNTTGAAGVYVGIDPRPVSYQDSLAPQAVTVGTAYVAPSGVTFSAPTDYAGGVAIGDLRRSVVFRLS